MLVQLHARLLSARSALAHIRAAFRGHHRLAAYSSGSHFPTAPTPTSASLLGAERCVRASALRHRHIFPLIGRPGLNTHASADAPTISRQRVISGARCYFSTSGPPRARAQARQFRDWPGMAGKRHAASLSLSPFRHILPRRSSARHQQSMRSRPAARCGFSLPRHFSLP